MTKDDKSPKEKAAEGLAEETFKEYTEPDGPQDMEEAEATDQAADQPQGNSTALTAFRIRDRIFRAGMQKVPRFRVVKAKEDGEEDEYLLDLFFKVVVAPEDMKFSEHFSHCFRPGVKPDSNGEDDAEKEAPKELLIPATGVKVTVNAWAEGFTIDVRDLITNETFRLQATEGIFLREIYPDPRANITTPMAELVIEARGCPYILGGRDWPRHWYHIAAVHNSEAGGLFEGANHETRLTQTPDRILTFNPEEEDEDEGAPPAAGEEEEQDVPLFEGHDSEFDRFWNVIQPHFDECNTFALGPDSETKISKEDSKAAFDDKQDKYGELDLVAISKAHTAVKLMKNGQRSSDPVDRFNWRALSIIVERELYRSGGDDGDE